MTDNLTTERVDHPPRVREEIDELMREKDATDNRTTELREKLNKLIIDIERLDIMLDSPAYGMTLGEYEQEREKLLDGFTQAIAATLESETCSMEYGGNVTESTKRMLGVYFCSECGSPTYNDCMPYYCIYCGGKVVIA